MATKYLTTDMMRDMGRFEWIATYVAFNTRTKAGRELSSGLQVKKVRGGWVYRFANSEGNCCRPCQADVLYDMIRRTSLDYYVNRAERLRTEAHFSEKSHSAS